MISIFSLGALLAFFLGFAVAFGAKPRFIIRTIPQSKSMYESNTYEKPMMTMDYNNTTKYEKPQANDYNKPPPSSTKYETPTDSSSNAYEQSSSSSSYADPTACKNDDECEAVDKHAECRYARCQCIPPFRAVDVGLSPMMSMSMRAAALQNRLASTVYQSSPAVNITCVPPFALIDGKTCLIQTSCCLTADEQARLTAISACSVEPDKTTLAAFNDPLPTISYKLVGAPAGVIINAATGAITTNSLFSGSSVVVTVQATLSSSPEQVATTKVTLLIDSDQCCIRAPAQLQQQVTFELFQFLFDVYFVGLPATDIVLIDFSGNTVPKQFDGAALSELFEGPCDKDISLVSAALAPTTDSTDFCTYLMLDSNNQLVFKTSVDNSDFLSDELIDAVIFTGFLDGVTAKCAIDVTVASCNGNQLSATVTTAFEIPSSAFEAMMTLMEQVPQRVSQMSFNGRDMKKRKTKV